MTGLDHPARAGGGARPALDDRERARRDALAGRLLEAGLGFNDLHVVHLGDRLGLYRALAEAGASTSAEVAHATGTHERYVREWLEHQAVGGVLDVVEDGATPGDRRYALPAGHAEVLLDGDSPAYMAAFARMMVGIARPLPSVLEAFRTGAGVPYADYPPDFCEGQGDMNRVAFVTSLGTEWLPSIPSVDARLRADPPARVADVACGTGFSTLEIARAYPRVLVDGLDLDEASIALAQEHLRGSGVEDRVRFAVRDAADPAGAGRYDLVTVFEALHDMARPVDALRAMRGLLTEGGSVVVADERVADAFAAPGDDTERLMYGYSVLHCLPVGMEEQPSAATGTVMRADTLRGYAREAGFAAVDVLPIEHDFWRFYHLRP
jgi:2-polyprenyl-3-methyl-5-hydroxy-6-metoxy-1,4-benzoquinol methylase